MELRHLQTFRAVASASSFTRAAAELGYVQSAVTAHVQALEKDLGVKLFDRLGRRTVLTAAGRELLPYARRMSDLSAEARAVVSGGGEPVGEVAVSASETLCAHRLPDVVRDLGQRHPGVRPRFLPTATGALDDDLVRAIGDGEVEVAFVLEESDSGEDGALGYRVPEHLAVERLCVEPLAVVAAPDHPLSKARSVGPRNLDGMPVLFTERGCAYRRVFEQTLSSSGVRPEAAAEFTSAEAVKRCAEAGMGVAVLAEVSVAEELEAGTLTALRWEGPELRAGIYMVWHRDRWLSPALAAVMDNSRRALHSTPVATIERHDSEPVFSLGS